ncbi:threonine ammonia-lyase [Alphaproteobacteria bacterium]|jgi:threonine dehydratase|nr:threonine ammonia-lyase [Alphaproteobacteria bacterium]|tara:strand:+ start:91 stop:1302 length:1212 start_codon:yes stop_codon:yes gene_type:complete
MKLTFKDICNVHKKITDVVKWTETSYSNQISEKIGIDTYIKFENRQHTGAFKIRGSYSKLLSLSQKEKDVGVIAMSAGNHAQGLAYIAKKMNILSHIVMPEGTPFTKIRRTKNFGGNVIIKGNTLSDSFNHVKKLISENGYTEVHPYNDINVIAGQGTVSIELLSDFKDIDILLVPVGGGGLIAGCSIAAKGINNNIKVIGVESELYPSLSNIMFNRNNKCKGSTLAEGIAVSEVGSVPLSIINDNVDDVITVSEASIERAIAMLAEHEKVVVEGAGAVGLAGMLEKPEIFKDKKVGIILCGGNIDSKVFSSILMRDLVRSGQVTTLTITIPDKPGQLATISQICANEGANVLEVEHSRFTMDLSASVAKLNITIETQNTEHLNSIIKKIEMHDMPVVIEGLI